MNRELPETLETTSGLETSPSLTDLVALVVEDSRTSPGEYLEETVVPHGGE